MTVILLRFGVDVKSIDEVYVYAAIDEEAGFEGIVGYYDEKRNTWMPLVAADEDRMEEVMSIAEFVSKQSNREIKLLKLSKREEIGYIKPGKEFELC